MNSLTLHSYAKLNLYLEVFNLGNDQYHNIKTIFERINLHDTMVLGLRPDKKINIICYSCEVPGGPSNLAYRAASLLQDNFNIAQGVNIKLIKRIPVGAGLGGGSSNAASVLIGLNKLWRLNLSEDKLVRLAKEIGCDVPFFIYDTPFAQGEGRGDKIKPLKALSGVRLEHILVVPKIKVSTPFIYKKWDAAFRIKKERVGLTRPKYNVKLITLAIKEKQFSLMSEALFNSLEQLTAKIYPEINRIREKLIRLGVKSILMSGSGPAVFGIVSSRKEAVFLCRQLKEDALWRVFTTHTHITCSPPAADCKLCAH